MHIALYPILAVILFAANAIAPQVGVVTATFSPLVLLLYFAHDKRAKQYDAILVILIAALAFYNVTFAGFFIISPLFAAVAIRYLLSKNIQTSWLPAVAGAALSFVVTFTMIYGIESYRAELIEFTSNALKTFIDAAKEANAPMTQSPYFSQIEQSRQEAALSVVMIFPAFNYVYTVFSAFVCMRLFGKIKNIKLDKFRMPDNFVWILIAGFSMMFLPVATIRFIGVNISMIFLVLYAFQGFDIILFWLNKFRVLPILKAIIFVFIFSEPPIILIISLIGLFSVWFNFYGKNIEQEQEPSE